MVACDDEPIALVCSRGRFRATLMGAMGPMRPIPLLDDVGSPVFCALFALLLFLQWKWPLRRRHFSVLRRLVRNFVMSIPSFVLLRLLLIPIPLAHTFWAQRNGIGLLNWIHLPPFFAAVIAFLLM